MASLPSQVQYLVAEDGKRIGVVLTWEDYQNLQAALSQEPDLLIGLDRDELQALSEGMLSPRFQERLHDLLEQNRQKTLDEKEQRELDSLLEKSEYLNILKARASYTLKYLEKL